MPRSQAATFQGASQETKLTALYYSLLKDYGVTTEQFMLAFDKSSVPELIGILDGAICYVQYLDICGISKDDICNLINHFEGLDKLPCIIEHYKNLERLQLPNDDIVRILINNQPNCLHELVASFKCFKAIDFTYQQISQITQQKQALSRLQLMMRRHGPLATLGLSKTEIVQIVMSDNWLATIRCLCDEANNIIQMQNKDPFLSALVRTDTELKTLQAKIRQWKYSEQGDVDLQSFTLIQQKRVGFCSEGETGKRPASTALIGKFQYTQHRQKRAKHPPRPILPKPSNTIQKQLNRRTKPLYSPRPVIASHASRSHQELTLEMLDFLGPLTKETSVSSPAFFATSVAGKRQAEGTGAWWDARPCKIRKK